MSAALRIVPFMSLLVLGACVTYPTGPSVMVLPGTGKDFEQFRYDDSTCRQFALEQSGGSTTGQTADSSMARSAALGTVIGAAAGAAIGGNQGAGIGAGTGLLMGGLTGSSTGQASAYGSQRRYDNAFIQCMYAKGHRVPVSGQFTTTSSTQHMQAPASVPLPPPPPPPSAPEPLR